MTMLNFHRTDNERLAKTGRRRTLTQPNGLDFSSNDYLALGDSAELRQGAMAALERGVALGSGGSRLLRGNTEEHEALEAEAARFFGAEAALYISSGYAANSLLFATLPQQGDLILYDELVHASAHEGMRLSRALCEVFQHNDVDAAERAITRWRKRGGVGTVWLAFETLYSMDGDRAPMVEFAALAQREDAILIVDEAHAVGTCGPLGRGLASELQGQENAIFLATCGKALGCEGALVLLPSPLRDFLVNRGRSFIFSTAPSPLMAAVVRASLDIIGAADDRRERLRSLVRSTSETLGRVGISSSGSHIQPIVLGNDGRTMAIAAALQARGFDVRGIRPPSVPPGTSRLRISITLNADEGAIAVLGDALKELL